MPAAVARAAPPRRRAAACILTRQQQSYPTGSHIKMRPLDMVMRIEDLWDETSILYAPCPSFNSEDFVRLDLYVKSIFSSIL
jgi:hypothetical protein